MLLFDSLGPEDRSKNSSRPTRYRVAFRTIDEIECFHIVVSFQDERKVIAVAAWDHVLNHSERLIYDVAVQTIGCLERDGEGVYVLNDDELTDRMEW